MEVVGLLFIFPPLHNFFPYATTYRLKQDEELENLKQVKGKCNVNGHLKKIILQICRRHLSCPYDGIFNMFMYLPHFTASLLSALPESYQNSLCNFINEVEKFPISRECSVFSKLSLVEILEKVLALLDD